MVSPAFAACACAAINCLKKPRISENGRSISCSPSPRGVWLAERGLDKQGIRLIGSGEITDDDQLAEIGDVALGIVTAHHYSAAHPSAINKKFVADFQAMHKFRPNFMAVGGWDGMRLITKGLEATKGAGGEALMNAMKGQIWESPRGQVYIDAQTREIVLDMYIRKVEKVNGQLWNVEFDAIKQMKDPGKSK